MTTKEWLNRGYKIDAEINALLGEQQRALLLATNAVANTEGEKVQTSKRNTTEDKFIAYASYSELINKRIDELYKIKTEIMRAINRVKDGRLRQLLILRYIKFEKWEQIADNLNYSREWITKALHPRALMAIEKIKSSF